MTRAECIIVCVHAVLSLTSLTIIALQLVAMHRMLVYVAEMVTDHCH
jgi:hypothetical protein